MLPCMCDDELIARMKADMEAIGQMHMPFGRFGPKQFPPRGVPIYDLPAEYLAWFARQGFPKGRLGELLRIVHQMKVDGSDAVFDVFRAGRGRTKLRPERDRAWRTLDPDLPF